MDKSLELGLSFCFLKRLNYLLATIFIQTYHIFVVEKLRSNLDDSWSSNDTIVSDHGLISGEHKVALTSNSGGDSDLPVAPDICNNWACDGDECGIDSSTLGIVVRANCYSESAASRDSSVGAGDGKRRERHEG